MDNHCIIIATLLVLIILYLIRERQNVETKMRDEYNTLYEEWKKGKLQEELSRQPSTITLVALDETIDSQKVIDALKSGAFTFKEAQ